MKSLRRLCAIGVFGMLASAAHAQQSPASAQRPHKDLPENIQIKLLKAHDQFNSAAADATGAIATAQNAQVQAQKQKAAFDQYSQQVMKEYGCVDFDTTGEGVSCITAPIPPKPKEVHPAKASAAVTPNPPPSPPPVPPISSAKH